MSDYKTVKVEREGGITWVILNRPEKRNAMNPTMHYEMLDVISEPIRRPKCWSLLARATVFARARTLRNFSAISTKSLSRDAELTGHPRNGAGGGCIRFRSQQSRWSTVIVLVVPLHPWWLATLPLLLRMRFSASARSTGVFFRGDW